MTEYSTEQNLRLSRMLLEKQGEINDLKAEVKRLAGARLVMCTFGVPEEAPQPFALINSDPQPKPFALGVQWPGGAVTVKSTPPERLGNTTSPSLDDYFTQYGQSDVVWLSEDLGSLAEMEERAEFAEAAVARVREYIDTYYDEGWVADIRRAIDGGDAT